MVCLWVEQLQKNEIFYLFQGKTNRWIHIDYMRLLRRNLSTKWLLIRTMTLPSGPPLSWLAIFLSSSSSNGYKALPILTMLLITRYSVMGTFNLIQKISGSIKFNLYLLTKKSASWENSDSKKITEYPHWEWWVQFFSI